MKLYLKEGRPQYRDAPRRCLRKIRWRAKEYGLVQEIVATKDQRAFEKRTGQRKRPSKQEFEVSGHNVLMLKVAVVPTASGLVDFSVRSLTCSPHSYNHLKAYSIRLGWPKSATSIKQSARRPLVLGRFEDNGRFRCRVQRYDTNGNSLSDEHKHQGSLNILPGDIDLIHSFSKHSHNLPGAVSQMLMRQERRFYHLFYPYRGIRNTWE
ncbi:hypothetical protein BDP55DRAFT_638826 [Colletotrichum godetiae]|uniref:Ig-like domain-containing protein n=1 Tax=Colletotrichum godetiae TaxID=1209918 RepID=A0AAJ0A970_9PEZI|nr:uncharacterized protein BDP55DRAFT_638826 [Colletotrichum godetiae]KAK1657371.1 hypothetical protein BDP55DRAFT_638826 [Colletotrichum godetiae]